ncbi:uncharacterized protein F5Z01DRAFT_659939 [Emericellopsis atlantica]|uniref:Uncharacterized protein n=1 Tax=Emericellopsis atlantica TaxID=2614577 RepID=A0A9P7ZI84_9HYPO|nr:uncharacterized protein F5Z01DRAFT_659939 [Emericellopsis atlantica]KAG9252589.1 hypothetical protein F5Z01DRAFT_659939 [Emericellopsis atlantica]
MNPPTATRPLKRREEHNHLSQKLEDFKRPRITISGEDDTASVCNYTSLPTPHAQESQQGPDISIVEHHDDIEYLESPIDTASADDTEEHAYSECGEATDLLNCSNVATQIFLIYPGKDYIRIWSPQNFLSWTFEDLGDALPSDWWEAIEASPSAHFQIRVASKIERGPVTELPLNPNLKDLRAISRAFAQFRSSITNWVTAVREVARPGEEVGITVKLEPCPTDCS